MISLILAALLPSLILIAYVCFKDRLQKLGHKDIMAHLANDVPSAGVDDQTEIIFDAPDDSAEA